MKINNILSSLNEDSLQPTYEGKILNVKGMLIEGTGKGGAIGDIYEINVDKNNKLLGEVVGLRDGKLLIMPLGETRGISEHSTLKKYNKGASIRVGEELLGRVIGALGEPIDFKGGVIFDNYNEKKVWTAPPKALERKIIDEHLSLGIKVIDTMLTIGKGQRIGIFAGAGVGKSTLLGSILRNSEADINVIALIGERGREVGEFVEKHLGEEGLKKSVLVVSSSDDAPALRIRAAAVATAIAEGFRDKGKNVLLMMDSLTRFAMAAREVGLAAGEPPTTKGYTPSVFAMLPRLLERPGILKKGGSITAIYTVLVEGDDMSDPIADACLAILDGHILLSRKLAQANQYPPVDVLKSISRLMNDIVDNNHKNGAALLRMLLSLYEQSSDLISIGAYSPGNDPNLDLAVKYNREIWNFFLQSRNEKVELQESLKNLIEMAKKIQNEMFDTN